MNFLWFHEREAVYFPIYRNCNNFMVVVNNVFFVIYIALLYRITSEKEVK